MSDLLPWMAPYSGWTVMTLLALLGLRVAARGLRRRPSRGPGGRCARCGYDLTGAPTLICSECGHARQARAPSLHLRRRPGVVLLGLLLATALPAFVVQRRVRAYGWAYYLRVGPGYWLWPDEVRYEASSGSYRIRITRDRRGSFDGARYSGMRCTITRSGKTVWSANDWIIDPGMSNEADDGTADSQLGPFADIDRDGSPEFLCTGNGGGNSGATTLHIISLAPEGVREMLDHHPPGQTDNIHAARDLDEDGVLDFVALDHSFVFFNTCHAGSAYPHYAYRIRAGKLVPDAALTRLLPTPSVAEMAQAGEQCRAAGWHAGIEDALFSPLEDVMLDLIYTGRSSEAYQFLDDAWPGPPDAKRQFMNELQQRLSKSPARAALEELGHQHAATPPAR